MRLQLGPWAPDATSLETPSLAIARNAIPTPTYYRPVRELQPNGSQDLDFPARGLTTVRLLTGSAWQIVGAGDKLYRVPSRNGALVELGGPYTFEVNGRWRFAQFRGFVLATNWSSPIQSFDLQGGAGFVNLSAEAPKCRFLAVVRDQVVAAHVNDADGHNAYRVRWSGFTDGLPDPTAWTYNAEKQTDFQDLSDVGVIQGITGGEFGTLLGEYGIVRMTYVGADAGIYQFDTVERTTGCFSSGSVVQYGRNTYYLGQEGWMAFDGAQARAIGRERVDRWFWDDFLLGYEDRIVAVADQAQGFVLWLYHGQGAGETPNRCLGYSPVMDRWFTAEVEADILGETLNFSLTLDDVAEFPDLSTDTRNLGDPRLWAQTVTTGAIRNGKVQGFTGGPQPATFLLPEVQIAEGRRGVVKRAIVLHEGGTARIRLGLRERQGGDQDWTPLYDPQADGVFRLRDFARYAQVRVELTGNWRRAQAVEFDGLALGER